MPVYKLYLLTLLFCTGCTSAPNIFDLSPKEKANQLDINPLIPKENIITRTNPQKYTGELVEKVTGKRLSSEIFLNYLEAKLDILTSVS